MEEIIKKLKEKISKDKILINEPMKKYTTFKIGGNADVFIKIKSQDELIHVKNVCKEFKTPITIIGNGSNVLVSDRGIRGITIKLEFNNIELLDETTISVGAGALLSKVSNFAYTKELSGLEFACGIPGSIGGAIRMNAGAHGGELKDVVFKTTYLDENCNIKTIDNNENEFGYRNSLFSRNKDYIIISAELKLKKVDKEIIKNTMDSNLSTRRENQPLNYPSAGSVFKRGENYIAAKLIDEAGLKGTRVGDAIVSEKHAGFIINTGEATAKDVIELIEIIKEKVFEKYKVKIETEIEMLGDFSTDYCKK